MILSVLIVNYNVCYFLEYCLRSVMKAVEHLEADGGSWKAEVFVIDNNSTDNSLAYLRPRFPAVYFSETEDNIGFARANNRLLEMASGEYVLILNPDTIVPEDCFLNNILFLRSQSQAGASGIRMIDGTGEFLPESKRGFPGVWNAVTKFTGLAGIFPRSRLFSGYYQGHLDNLKNHEVAILSGAYLLADRQLVQKIGGFDEQFFMYAEDIDLSFRISKAGFKNYYFAESTIIHFKGESTRKDHKYVRQFYLAMIQFVHKHFKGTRGFLFTRLLEMAIRLKAAFSKPGRLRHIDSKTDIVKTFLEGDSETCAGLRRQLLKAPVGANREFVADKKAADEIIYCVGKGLKYKDVINLMQTDISYSKKIFHIGAGAIIGSDSKNEQGSVRVL